MDAPLLLALACRRLRTHGAFPLEAVWAGPRALGLAWRKEGWILLLHPQPELWILPLAHPAWKQLAREAPKDSARAWGAWLQGARLVGVEGDPRERWLALRFQRRAITGRLETVRVAYQAIPGRAGIRLDGEDVQPPRLGLGCPFPPAPPSPLSDPPPFLRWRERWGPRMEEATAGLIDEVIEGSGDLEDRHRAWSQQRAERLILAPLEAAQHRAQAAEAARLVKLQAALEADRRRHASNLPLKAQAARLSAELYRLKGATGRITLEDGTELALPEGRSAEAAAQAWFSAGKKAERGLQRIAALTQELAQARRALSTAPPQEPPKKNMDKPKGHPRPGGKGQAFRSLKVEGFDVLIGKSDAENDQLTFRVADRHDLWLHVAHLPGSHVVIRNPDRLSELPSAVLERAAQLAAYHSKARASGKVEVHIARIADLSKPKGFAPGKVILKKWRSVRVYPKE